MTEYSYVWAVMNVEKNKDRCGGIEPAQASRQNIPTTGYYRVDRIRRIIGEHQDLEHQTSKPVMEYLNVATAKYFGFEAAFTDEQKALTDLLVNMNADPHAITLAWGTYSEIMKSETNVR